LKADFMDSSDDYVGMDMVLKKPPVILFFLGVFSVLFGTVAGLYGVLSKNTASNSQEYLIGLTGYLLTAVVPIVFLQVIRHSHQKALEKNHDEPYDIYAGAQNQTRFLKVVLVGLISAALSIWVFFLPIAEKFAV
jgi:hypothetical protein